MMLLQGLKVLDFSTLLPGPFATLMLADLGAEVVHVTREGQEEKTAMEQYLQRSKKSIAADLKSPEVIASLKALIMEYDIIIEQFRPGVMQRLGLGYEQLKAINPRIIYCSITGYGQTGPYKDRAGHDINYVSMAGIQGYSGTEQQGPALLGVQVADLAGGSLHAVVGILSAVIYRMRTGEGQHLDISMTDCALSLHALFGPEHLVNGQSLRREQLLLNGGTFYGYYETKDGRYFSVGSLEPKFRENLCKAIERLDLVKLAMSTEANDEQQFKEELQQQFKEKTFAEWQSIFEAADACVEPVLTFEETVQHPLFVEREMFVDVKEPSGKTQKQLACPIKSTIFKASYEGVAVKAGANNEELLGTSTK